MRTPACSETSTARRARSLPPASRSRVALRMPRCVVTRRVHFNAAHRLHNPRWSEAENERVFGLCNSPNFHGHNYNLDVSVEGEIDPATGFVLDIAKLKLIVTECLVRHLDHKNLNLDVPWFRSEERRVGKECRCRWSWDQ